MIKLIECPRDAMQGIKQMIPTQLKADYINSILKVGFDTIDFGSFVSPKAIPQLQDTAEVLKKLDLSSTKSKLLAIIANQRGAQDAVAYDEIKYLGFPFSISETFQQRNTNSSIAESLVRVEEIQNLCVQNKKELVVYISMAFGNPYNDEWNSEIVLKWTERLHSMGIRIIALADTIGVSDPENITYLFKHLIPAFKDVEFGAHLHSIKEKSREKIQATAESGCLRFDSAIHGFGGCPMAKDDLTGNIATEDIVSYFNSVSKDLGLNNDALLHCYEKSWEIFNHYH
ncbi:MAG: isopropylmalate/homocitrate/citramalate synthase [Bacteroidetes bacterium]|jgi:hydroxymethylglutaryl-CoA lyase|nr:isopropylmalate/homocitrate/citramalate synthase [Bacteroidota bacterium]